MLFLCDLRYNISCTYHRSFYPEFEVGSRKEKKMKETRNAWKGNQTRRKKERNEWNRTEGNEDPGLGMSLGKWSKTHRRKPSSQSYSHTSTPFKTTINFASLVSWNRRLLALGLGTYIGEVVKIISLKVQRQHNNLPCYTQNLEHQSWY